MSENTRVHETSSSEAEDELDTLAHRMILYFYHSQAIAKDAWDIHFWQKFGQINPDVELGPKELRSYFFHEIMRKPREWRGLEYEQIQYLNPLFNRIRKEVLEYRDLVEGIDYVHITDPVATLPMVTNDTLPPLFLEPSNMVSSSRATKRYITPTAEQIRSFVSAGLSELLWTEDEKTTKTPLNIEESMLRIGVLTKNSISLTDCIEPGMACYERFHQTDRTEALKADELKI
uniref:Uncharacterized protein n=1 Tax=Anopheles epiroticus TaxID=199890 RepID=A0A182PTM9_9DIPT